MILVYHTLAVHHSLRIIQDMKMWVMLIDWFEMQCLEKCWQSCFWSDFMMLKQETRSIRIRALYKEEMDFHLLSALLFHDLSRKKSDQLSSLWVAIVKRCMDSSFHDKFQVKEMYIESHDIKTKYIWGVNSMTEPRYWKIGKQVFGSVQRKCSWLVQSQQIYQQRWISQYQRMGIIKLSCIHKCLSSH